MDGYELGWGLELGKLDKSPQTRPAGMFVTDAELCGYKIARDPIQGRYDGCVITLLRVLAGFNC